MFSSIRFFSSNHNNSRSHHEPPETSGFQVIKYRCSKIQVMAVSINGHCNQLKPSKPILILRVKSIRIIHTWFLENDSVGATFDSQLRWYFILVGQPDEFWFWSLWFWHTHTHINDPSKKCQPKKTYRLCWRKTCGTNLDVTGIWKSKICLTICECKSYPIILALRNGFNSLDHFPLS